MSRARWIGRPMNAAAPGIALVLLASCSQSTPSAKSPTPSPALNPSPVASLPTASPPPGGAVPALLLGDWYLPPAAEAEIAFASPCPSPPTPQNCYIELTLTASTEHLQIKAGANTTE